MMRKTHYARYIQAAGLAVAAASLGFIGSTSTGCLDRPIEVVEPRTTSTVVERLTQSGVDKIDVLLAIDNSISMADKQAILSAAVPDLVERLVNPICVDAEGNPSGTQPTDPLAECEGDANREFPPVVDINVGIVSSSLGALTADQCTGNPTADDKGHLLSRGAGGGTVDTYEGKGFLAWDPSDPPKRNPPGLNDKGVLIENLRDMVEGTGQEGCGYEMQMESVHRFLSDPDPYDSLERDGNSVKEVGTDQTILTQRKDFMRSNSLLAIIMLTDENDCSVDVSGQGYLALSSSPFYKASTKCAEDPNDPCCYSCGLSAPEGCTADSACDGGPKYTIEEDHPNLRCFEQKRRYGVDFLYPVQRYVNAFTQVKIDPSRSDLAVKDPADAVANPVFSDLSGTGGSIRDPGLVFVAGIVGVPWQALARKCPVGTEGGCPDGSTPDLIHGFKTFLELQQEDAFTKLIGDPDGNIPPSDPFMKEAANAMRSGTSEITGYELPGDNPANGNDRLINNDDLQFACIFPLVPTQPAGPDCTAAKNPGGDSPLCNGAEQVNAKAYPGLRELALLRGMGDQGIFASICPQEAEDTSAANYGYRPAVGAIIDRLKRELGGQCLPRTLKADEKGLVGCFVLEATATNGSCDCSAPPGRRAIPKDLDDGSGPNPAYNAILAAQEDEFANPDWDCFCEIVQLAGTEGETCQDDKEVDSAINGWCYIDASASPPVGNAELVASCPPNEKRIVRFVNDGEVQPGGTAFITCSGE